MARVFSDIGKETNDLIGKDYTVGQTKLELNTTTENNVKFTVSGNQDAKSGAVTAEIKAKWSDKPSGILSS